MNQSKLRKIFEILRQANPEPKTELVYKSDYTLLVSIALSAQSTDVAVNKATAELFRIADTPEKMIKLGESSLKKYIRTIGLYNAKAKNIILLSKILLEKFNGSIPKDFNELVSLPGIGTKTAYVFLNCFYQHPVIAVDTHVFRVSNRVGIVKTENIAQTTEKLNKIVPHEFKLHAHHWLILHGRYICKARRPECAKCTIYSLCEYKAKTA